ncbi:MAG: ABC transporter substrate-binding protein [Dethiobacter sp.]|nr:ABC transporter substrate-binding protein [Dethiobacter sp.]
MKKWGKKCVLVALLMSLLLLVAGCGARTAVPPAKEDGAATLRPLRIAYQGLTCEAPTYIAYEKGFFAEEGFAVEMVKGDFNFIRDSFAAGRIDAVAGLALTWIKPLEQGVNAKVTAALHKGCLYAYTLADSGIEKVEDLKGKRIGVPAIGGAPMMLLARDLAVKGIDMKEVEWRAFPVAELELALDKGEVDAVAVGEPFGTTFALNLAKFRVLLNQSIHAPYHAEYCCLWLIDGDLVENEPEVAAAITRAVLRAAQYVEDNPVEVGALIVEKGFVLGTAELNGQILEALEFVPSVAGAREALLISFEAGKEIGVIDTDTDVVALTDRAFIQLPGLQ